MTALRLGHLYPAQMSMYGDRGNILTLQQRAAWRGLTLTVVPLGLGADAGADAQTCHGVFFGGGQDRDQVALAEDLRTHKGAALRALVAAGAPLLAVCGGYQLLGSHYTTADGVTVPGLDLLPLWTQAGARRLVGNVVVAPDPQLGLGAARLVGFENHSGRTHLGPGCRPLGHTVVGEGNNGEDGGEGVWAGTVVGTYLHGPVLPRNPALADWWLRAACRQAGLPDQLTPLDDGWELAAQAEGVERAARERGSAHRGRWRWDRRRPAAAS
ncbi:MAG TPA: glutamine amidotransferase [Candidatus Dormibacteraeota bacterium]|nr:glutamine amidotransferase [Candidatus Dormibacteraeota bacterium]